MHLPLDLYPGQLRAVTTQARELLIGAEHRAGASHLLRAMALLRAAQVPGSNVVVASPDERASREDHLEGAGGVWAMLDPDRLPAGTLRWLPGGQLRIETGAEPSTIRFTTWEEAARRVADLVLVDDADELSVGDYHRMRERALARPGAEGLTRLAVVSHRPAEGWINEHWRQLNGSGARVSLLASDLPEALRGPAPIQVVESFGDYIDRVNPRMLWYPHVTLQVDVAQRVIDGEILRLLVSAPPRYFKSLIWSRLLPAYFLSRRPHEWMALVSASAKLAEELSSDARDFFRTGGGRFRLDSMDKSLWRTPQGGGCSARGVGGWFLGKGFNGGEFDDPFATWAEAMKPSVQAEVETYFWRTFMSRVEVSGERPAWVVVNHQALAEGDLRGRIIKRERMGEHPIEGWHVLTLPAILRPRREPFPPSMTVIPDTTSPTNPIGPNGRYLAVVPRAMGEPLCPWLQGQDLESLLRLEKSDAFAFAATHQQEPFADQGGGLFRRWFWGYLPSPTKLEPYRELYPDAFRLVNPILSPLILALAKDGVMPQLYREARAWDIAASIRGEGDSSASVRGGVTTGKLILFTDAKEEARKASEVLDMIVEQAKIDGKGVEVILPDEPAGAGKIMVANFSATLRNLGFRVVVVSTSGSKYVRATTHAGLAMFNEETGKPGSCYMLPGPWNGLFCERHHAFDGVTKPLDLVDAASYLVAELSNSTFLRSGVR